MVKGYTELFFTSVNVEGEERVKAVALWLIERSTEFRVIPLPDDFWNVAIKHENSNKERLTKFVKSLED